MRTCTKIAALVSVVFVSLMVINSDHSDSSGNDAYPTDVHYKFTVTFDVPGVTGCSYYTVDFGDGTQMDSRTEDGTHTTSTTDPASGETTYHIMHLYPEVPGTYTMVFTAFNDSGETAVNGLNVCLMGYPVLSLDEYGGYNEIIVRNGADNGGVEGDDYYTRADKPEDPVRDGYSFTGWYTDETCTELFDWDAPVRMSSRLYAGWTEDTGYTVTFYVDREPYFQGTYHQDEQVYAPEDPVKEGYAFSGWKNFTEGMTVTGDTGFCAQFSPVSKQIYKVTYTIDGTTYSRYITPGTVVDPPSVDGKTFEGWYSDSAMTVPFDSSEVSSDVTIYPRLAGDGQDSTFPVASVIVMVLGSVTAAACCRRYPALAVVGAAVAVLGVVDLCGLVHILPR